MTISSSTAIGLISIAIGSTTAASLWRERGDGLRVHEQSDPQSDMWRCIYPKRTPGTEQLWASAGATGATAGESSVTCQPNSFPGIQSISADAMFRALAR